MAAPAVGSVGTQLGGSTSTTANVPVPSGSTGPTIVDVVAMYVEVAHAVTPPAGFTEAPDSPVIATGSGAHYLHVYERRTTGTEGATYGFTIAASVGWRDA